MPQSKRTNLIVDQNLKFNQPAEVSDNLPSHIDKLAFGYRCKLCQQHPNQRSQVDQHVDSRFHQSMLVLLSLQNNQAFALANKNDVTVDIIHDDVLHTELSVYSFQVRRRTRVRLIARIHNHNEESVTIQFCDFTRPRQKNFYKIIDKPQRGMRIDADSKLDVVIEVKVPNVGKFSKAVFFKFSCGKYPESFYIVRQLSAVCSDNITKELAPTAPYKPIARAQLLTKNLEIVRGEAPPAVTGDTLEIVRQLTAFRISPVFRSAVNRGLKTDDIHAAVNVQEEIENIRGTLEAPLTFQNYTKRWSTLLRLEKLQADISIQTYNMAGVSMKVCRENQAFLVLEVPGLAENRPSLMKGDVLFVSFKKNDNEEGPHREYEGHVHRTLLDCVWLGFHNSLKDIVRNNPSVKFNVRFVVPEHMYRVQDRAVKMASEDPLLENVLFPKEQAGPPVMRSLEAEVRYFNHDVSENPDQARAVKHIISGTSRPAPYILYGPPGTGKTVTLVESILQIVNVHKDSHIIACAPSNSAADLLTERLASHLERPQDTIFRIHARSRVWESVPGIVKPFSNHRDRDFYYPSRSKIQGFRIIVTTLSTAGRLVSAAFPPDHFTHLFVDECGQATESECVIALAGILNYDTTAHPNGGQVVLAGDPQQLGPIVHSPFAEKFGFGVSFLERLMTCSDLYRRTDGADPPYDVTVLTELRRNYRSHPAILEVPNREFYHNDLTCWADKDEREMFCDWPGLAVPKVPVIFHGTLGEELREGSSPSFFNPDEISVVMGYIEQIMEHRRPGFDYEDIGIITPYRKQVAKIRKLLEQRERRLRAIRVGTVEEFQGGEKRVIIVTTVRSNPDYGEFDVKFKLGFVANPKKFNVAITRAMSLLIVVGNPFCLKQDPHWGSFIKYCQQQKVLIGVDIEDEAEDTVTDVILDDVVKEMLQKAIDVSQVRPDTPVITNFYTAPDLKDENIKLVTNVEEFRAFSRRVRQAGSVVAIDAEWTPNLIQRAGQEQTLALLQFAVNDTVYILDIPALKRNLPNAEWAAFFIAFFTSEDVIKVGYQLSGDLSMILTTFRALNKNKSTSFKDELHPSRLQRVCDLSVRCHDVEIIPDFFLPRDNSGNVVEPGCHSLSDLVRKTEGKPLDKGPQLSNWDVRPLSKEQLRYAALDAFVLLSVFTYVSQRLQTLNRNDVDLFKKLNNSYWNKLYGPNGREM